MAVTRTRPTCKDHDELIRRQQEELARLREALARTGRERDRLKRQNARLKQQLDAARRAGFRQAAPFAKDRPQGRGTRPDGAPAPPTGVGPDDPSGARR